MMLTAIYDNLSSYGQPLNLKSRLGLWKMTLEDDYSIAQVLAALKQHCKASNTMPAPADVIAVLNPPKSKITQAEFIHAKKQWELEGYPSYSYYAMLVKEYESQEGEERHKPLEIADNLKKAIGLETKLIG